jgi:NADPH:quinone reductase-like Zn-dependent oxidoreductase
MQAIVLERARTLRQYPLDAPAPAGDRVLVRMDHGCILDRDLDAFHYGRGKMPRVFGSSLIGTVVTDSEESTIQGGNQPARSRDSRGRIIPFPTATESAPQPGTRVMVLFDEEEDGGLRRFVSVDPGRCHPISAGVPDEKLPVLPDVAFAAGILDTLGAARGEVLVVLGARAGGVVLALTAARMGVVAILVDPSRPRLQQAEDLGVIHTINPLAASLPEELGWLTGGQVNYIVDTSGDEEFFPAALASLPPGGVFGVTTPMNVSLTLGEIADAGITVRGLTRVPVSGEAACQIAETLDLERLVSLSVPLGEIPTVVPSILRERGTFLRLTTF